MQAVYFPTVFGIGFNKTEASQRQDPTLMFLTQQNWSLLLEKAMTIEFEAGEIIVEQDSDAKSDLCC